MQKVFFLSPLCACMNNAVCTFVISWKNTKFQMLVHKNEENNVL